jgi:leucyl aminopeptidase
LHFYQTNLIGLFVKLKGNMIGMHRDKCGAAFVAGFFKTLSILKPKGLKVYGTLCFARNSVGEGKTRIVNKCFR